MASRRNFSSCLLIRQICVRQRRWPQKLKRAATCTTRCANKSQETQGPILQWLRERAIEHRSFYIVNAILVKGSREIAEALAARPDVARVEGNPRIRNALPQPV